MFSGNRPQGPGQGSKLGGMFGGGQMGVPNWMGGLMGGGMLGQGLAGLFGGGKNPFEAGNPYYEQIMNQLPGYFEPWISAGKGALPTLQEQFGQLISDPNALYNKFASGYKESPGYQWRQQQGQGAALNAAAAGGMAGTPQAQQQAAQISENIANQDFQNYLQSILGMYGQGLGGLSGISQQGLAGSIGLGEDLASVLARQAEAAMRGQELEQRESGMDWGNILGGIGSLAGMFFGGPAGGMAGGAAGRGLGGLF